MSEWLDNQNKPTSSIRQLLQERIEKANPRHIICAGAGRGDRGLFR